MSLPKYFKAADGFCYVATEALEKMPEMTHWDGAVDARGFAVEAQPEAKPVKPAKPARAARGLSAPTEPADTPPAE